jgi:hypothetical protein
MTIRLIKRGSIPLGSFPHGTMGRSKTKIMEKMNFPKDIQRAIEQYKRWKRNTMPSKEVLEKLYWEYELSLQQIAQLFKVGLSAIHYWFRKHNIQICNNIDTIVKARTKYPKKPFNGTPEEMAYQMGLAHADFNVRRHSRQISISVGTTHRSMTDLFHRLYQPYGHIKCLPIYIRKTGIYSWMSYTYLDDSFGFLLEDTIPQWILENDKCFYAYLAGFIDGDGCISISHKNNRSIRQVLTISNNNVKRLKVIKYKLEQLSYHCSICPKKNVYDLRIYRKNEIERLLRILPLKHSEKLRRRELFFTTKSAKHWKEIENKVIALRVEIERGREEYVKRAKEEWLQRHKLTCLVDA